LHAISLGDVNKQRELVASFQETYEQVHRQLREAVSSMKQSDAERYAQMIKENALTIGFEELYKAYDSLQALATKGRLDRVKARLPSAHNICLRSLAAFQEYLTMDSEQSEFSQ